jgi:hypothetical protein
LPLLSIRFMDKLIKCSLRCLLVLCCFFYSKGAHGQRPVGDPSPALPTDSLRPVPADSVLRPRFVLLDSLSYRFAGDGNFSRGNVNRSLMVLRGEIMLQGPVVDIVTHPRFTYGQQNHQLAERDLYADLFIDVFKKRRVYAFSLATVERSNLRRIDWRQLAGAGIGLRLVRSSRHTLSLTNAIIHESTNFRERPTLTTQRNSTRLKGRHAFLGNKMRFTHITFLQPALADFSNLRWNTHLSLELPLTRWMAIRTSFENSYERVVEATRKRNDTRVTFGIVVGNRPL